MSALDRPAIVDYRNNGKKPKPTFSAGEMQRRQDAIRGWMASSNVDACLFTSYHNINYLSDFLYCYFGRKYGLVITQKKTTSVTAAIDGGQPARRTFGDNVTYTDWSKDNYFLAVKDLMKGAKRIGIEFDHVNLDFRKQLAGCVSGRRVRRRRRALDALAHDQDRRRDQAHHQDDAHRRHRRRGLRRGHRRGRARARGGAAFDRKPWCARSPGSGPMAN